MFSKRILTKDVRLKKTNYVESEVLFNNRTLFKLIAHYFEKSHIILKNHTLNDKYTIFDKSHNKLS